MITFLKFKKYISMKYVRLIFGSKVLNYERHLTYLQFSIYRKIIENNLEDLNYPRVTKWTQEQAKEIGWMKNCFLYPLHRFFFSTLSRFCMSADLGIKQVGAWRWGDLQAA